MNPDVNPNDNKETDNGVNHYHVIIRMPLNNLRRI